MELCTQLLLLKGKKPGSFMEKFVSNRSASAKGRAEKSGQKCFGLLDHKQIRTPEAVELQL